MKIRNKTSDAREIAVGDFNQWVEPGETADVPDEIAEGVPPTGEPGSPDYLAGRSGLLAQEDVWEKATGPDKPKPQRGNAHDAPADGEED